VSSGVDVMGPILVDPQASNTLYLAAMEGGFLKSTDGGENWELLGTIPGGMASWVSQDWQNPNTFYAAGGGAPYKSTDGGESWQATSEGIPGGVSAVTVSPSDPRILYAGVLEGDTATVYRSDDGGESWEAQN